MKRITKIDNKKTKKRKKRTASFCYTENDMRQDAEYYLAEHLTKTLLDNKSIAAEEYGRIMWEHAQNFEPTLAPLLL